MQDKDCVFFDNPKVTASRKSCYIQTTSLLVKNNYQLWYQIRVMKKLFSIFSKSWGNDKIAIKLWNFHVNV